MSNEFSVYQFFPDDTYERVLHFVGAQEAVECAKRLSVSVGGRLGTTRRIIITDGGDHTCFEWKYGEGVTYPPLSVTFPPRDPAPAPGSSESSAKL